jgi:hypothetical protein
MWGVPIEEKFGFKNMFFHFLKLSKLTSGDFKKKNSSVNRLDYISDFWSWGELLERKVAAPA